MAFLMVTNKRCAVTKKLKAETLTVTPHLTRKMTAAETVEKRQSLPSTVFLKTSLTWTINLHKH